MQSERLMTDLTIESAINGVDLGRVRLVKDTKLIPKQWLVKDMIFYDTTMKQYIELIREAADTGRIDREKISLHFSKAEVTSKQKIYPFSRMMLPALEGAMARAGGIMNKFSAARLGIAIERYRRANGTLPGDLSDLVPDYIAALPSDTLTGKPLAWEHHGTPRYKIPLNDRDSQSWIYDAVLAAIHAGDLGQLKAFAEKGWKITRPEPGSARPPESEPNMAGMMPYGMMGPGCPASRKRSTSAHRKRKSSRNKTRCTTPCTAATRNWCNGLSSTASTRTPAPPSGRPNHRTRSPRPEWPA